MAFGLAEGKLNSTDLDPWKKSYFNVNKTQFVSFFVYRIKSREGFRIYVLILFTQVRFFLFKRAS